MKNLILCVCAIMLTTGLFSQEKRKEVGINFSSLDNFGLSYKSGTSKSLWRYNILSSHINSYNNLSIQENIDTADIDYQGYGIGASIGKEFRNSITEKVEFRYGFDVGFSYDYSQSENTNLSIDSNPSTLVTSNFYTPSVNAVIGFNYLLSSDIAFGLEILPSISYRKIKTVETAQDFTQENTSSNFDFNLNNDFARLSLSYRF